MGEVLSMFQSMKESIYCNTFGSIQIAPVPVQAVESLGGQYLDHTVMLPDILGVGHVSVDGAADAVAY